MKAERVQRDTRLNVSSSLPAQVIRRASQLSSLTYRARILERTQLLQPLQSWHPHLMGAVLKGNISLQEFCPLLTHADAEGRTPGRQCDATRLVFGEGGPKTHTPDVRNKD